ncbi:hypothetical protein VOLCADRAFT_70359 [Volvox carteri f. nagariensis]|uniref:HD domain-containing protein n=1 Tax=Volvox carteri f. nagariensis TaxID=3068 RepID=D8UKC2_VOLCA|nr:uncharacterized protein VOLCADRAFT_70359 [Volvox carteri f. nagariensis]EFJ39838.1 hypothetical protein VOLCADRAFT_70359 [Volvox carteri f. nagariensis]|eukprot:XP_002959110.1 hypothetical protein VOLCADRAFT_70359 [Volvox carteri f. nagariensis]
MTVNAQASFPPDVVAAAEDFVRCELAAVDASHDFAHIQRVRANARNLAQLEGLNAGAMALVDLAALLHDVRDWKYSGNHDATTEAVTTFLAGQGLDSETISRVTHIISKVGFKEELAGSNGSGAEPVPALSLEAAIVQDADRCELRKGELRKPLEHRILDAIGAIGIARCFTFGGAKHRVLYDPEVPPREGLSKEQYMAGGAQSTTINHFYEKLLKLKALMKTSAGAQIAAKRHEFMEQYLQQFHNEWNGLA